MLYYLAILLLSLQQKDIVIVYADKQVLKSNKSTNIVIQVRVKQGYHVQANQVSNEALIPTAISLSGIEYIETGKAVYPAAKKIQLKGTDEWLQVYGGSFQIIIPVKLIAQPKKGSYSLQAEISYQACDARTCFFPKTVSFEIPYRIE